MNSISQKLNEDQLNMIEAMAATGFSAGEIAEVLEVDALQFEEDFANKKSLVYKKYRKGFLQASFELRKRIFKDAGYGSSPAQTLAKKIMDDAEYKIQHQ
jgi:hypothetical protein